MVWGRKTRVLPSIMMIGFSLVCAVCGAAPYTQWNQPPSSRVLLLSLLYTAFYGTHSALSTHTILYMRMCSVGLGAAAVRSLVQVGAIVASLPNPLLCLCHRRRRALGRLAPTARA